MPAASTCSWVRTSLRSRRGRTWRRGFRAIKIKVGREKLSEDVARLRAVRDVIGEDMPLMVDANMRWTTERAVKAARKFREMDVYWLEEPPIPDDYQGMARIAELGGLPVAAGENLRTVYEFRHTLEQGKVAFPEPDVSNIGGITNWMRVAQPGLRLQSACDIARHPRDSPASAGGDTQPVLPGSAQFRLGALHVQSAAAGGWRHARGRRAGPWRGFRLGRR